MLTTSCTKNNKHNITYEIVFTEKEEQKNIVVAITQKWVHYAECKKYKQSNDRNRSELTPTELAVINKQIDLHTKTKKSVNSPIDKRTGGNLTVEDNTFVKTAYKTLLETQNVISDCFTSDDLNNPVRPTTVEILKIFELTEQLYQKGDDCE